MQTARKKHEWRRHEKHIYVPKQKPILLDIPTYQFATLAGEGNPNSPYFADCIAALYAVSYAIKMSLKKLESPPAGYVDYTVYPLEGIWDLNEKGRQAYDGTFNKDDLVFTLMIRQPDFVTAAFFHEMVEGVRQKKPHALLDDVKFAKICDGKCIQMLHVGKFEDEPATFAIMEDFAESQNLTRASKVHREIYLSDFRKVAPEKRKTVLRFQVDA